MLPIVYTHWIDRFRYLHEESIKEKVRGGRSGLSAHRLMISLVCRVIVPFGEHEQMGDWLFRFVLLLFSLVDFRSNKVVTYQYQIETTRKRNSIRIVHDKTKVGRRNVLVDIRSNKSLSFSYWSRKRISKQFDSSYQISNK